MSIEIKPKRGPATPYLDFVKEEIPKLRKLYPGLKSNEYVKMAAITWTKMRNDEKTTLPKERSNKLSDKKTTIPKERSNKLSDKKTTPPKEKSNNLFDKKTTLPKEKSNNPSDKKTTIPKEKSDKKSNNKEIPDVSKQMQCLSVRSVHEPHLQCLLPAKNGQKYCAIHLAQDAIVPYKQMHHEISMEPTVLHNNNTNPIIKKIDILTEYGQPFANTVDTNKGINGQMRSRGEGISGQKENLDQVKKEPLTKKTKTMREQKVSTIIQTYKETEDDLETKLLMLINDEYGDKISELVGPVFQDITLAEDDVDPITFDQIWTMDKGIKTPASVNKYYLFSYIDSKDKIRCFTIFSIYNMINDNNLIHPKTGEAIPEHDVNRAKKLIQFYQEKVQLFDENDNSSPEFKLKNQVTKLFKRFHRHSIYFEEKWILDLDNKKSLYRIINETAKIISNNIRSINPNLPNLRIFGAKEKSTGKNTNSDEELFNLKKYIVGEWERLIDSADSPENQIPIWILASGLSCVVPEVKQKYPDLDYMMS